MTSILIIVVLIGAQISAAHIDYATSAECEMHRAAVLRDPVDLAPGKHPLVVAVCREEVAQ